MSGSATAGLSVLTAAPDPAHAATVRIFGAAVGRTLLLDEERIEDLKLILTEICVNGAEAPQPVPLRVEIGRERGAIAVTCIGAGRPPRPDAEQAEHRGRLVRALAPDLRWDDEGAVRFTVPI